MDHDDRRVAAAEARLDRHDDEVAGRRAATVDGEHGPVAPPDGVDPDGYGFHLDDPDADLLREPDPRDAAPDVDDPDDPDGAGEPDGDGEAVLDAMAEAFNARDLDALLEMVAPDGELAGPLGTERDDLPVALEDLWLRRPTCCLTRGLDEAEHVGIVWEHDGAQWWRLAAVRVAEVTDTTVGVVEITDDPVLLERVAGEPPSRDELEEGARWAEWDEGVDGEEPA